MKMYSPEIINLAQQVASAVRDDLRKKTDASILSAIQAHIPEATADNLSEYTDRISIRQPEGKGYPQEMYLDYNTLNRQLICIISDVEVTSIENGFKLGQVVSVPEL